MLCRSIFFTFQTSENFPATFVIDFHFKSITIRKYDLYNLYYFTFINMYFVNQHAVYLGKCTMWAWKECILLLLRGVFKKYQIKLIDSVVQVHYSFTDFLLTWSIHYWWGRQQHRVLKSSSITMDLLIFLLSVFRSCILVIYCLTTSGFLKNRFIEKLTPLLLCNVLFYN